MIDFLGFVGTGPHAHPTHKAQKVLRILIAHQLSRETQPSKVLPILKNWESENYEGVSATQFQSVSYEDLSYKRTYVCDDHAESTQQTFVSRLSREWFCSHHRSYSCPESERWGNKYLLVTSCGRQKPSEGECQSQRLHTAQICHSKSDLGNYLKDTWILSLLKVKGSTTNILYEVP